MFTGLPHRFGEFGATGGDVLPEGRCNTDRVGIAVEVAVQRQNHPAFGQSGQDRRGEIGADLVLAQAPGFAVRVDSLRAQGVDVVIPVIRSDIANSGDAVFVGGADDGVQRQAIELVLLRNSGNERAHALAQLVAIAHRLITGGFAAGGAFLVCAPAAPGFSAVDAAAGSINTPVALSVTVTVATLPSSNMISMILPRT